MDEVGAPGTPGGPVQTKPFGSEALAEKVTELFQFAQVPLLSAQAMPVSQTPLAVAPLPL